MKETWSRDEASHEIDPNVEALRALTHCTCPCMHLRTHMQSEGQENASEDEKGT